MSIVRYVNKKTGRVALYESTSHYDPVTKQSRPIRKYLGTEDPETGELIPSSGKRGRKKKTGEKEAGHTPGSKPDYKFMAEKFEKEIQDKDARIRILEEENQKLRAGLERVRDMVSGMIS